MNIIRILNLKRLYFLSNNIRVLNLQLYAQNIPTSKKYNFVSIFLGIFNEEKLNLIT
jgi:hypothetical protein